jgi:hypothetical protein
MSLRSVGLTAGPELLSAAWLSVETSFGGLRKTPIPTRMRTTIPPAIDRTFHDSIFFPVSPLLSGCLSTVPTFFFAEVFDCEGDADAVNGDPHPLHTAFSDELGIPQDGQTIVDDGDCSFAIGASLSHNTAVPHFAQNLSPGASAEPQLPHTMDGLTATISSFQKT